MAAWLRGRDLRRRWQQAMVGSDDGAKGTVTATWLAVGHLLALPAIALSNVLLGLAALLTPWRALADRLRRGRPLLLMIGTYLLFLAGSILVSHDPTTSLRAASDPFNFLVPLLVLMLLPGAAQARWTSRALIAVACGIAAWALVQYLLGADQLSHRPTGPFSHYMTLGGFLIMVDCFLLAWLAFGGGWRRWQAWVAVVLIQIALLVSYTRNAWIALALLASLVVLARRPRLILAWAPLLLLLTLLAPTPLVARFGSIFDVTERSNYDRLCMAYAGAGMIADRPLLGQGPTMVRELYPLYRHPTAPRLWVPHLHNSFLNLGAERGILSLLAFLGLLAVSARRALRRLRASPRPDRVQRELLVAVLLVIVACLVTGLFEDYWNDTEIQRLVLFALALPFGLRGEGDDEASSPPLRTTR